MELALNPDCGNRAGQRRLLGIVGSLRRDSLNRKLLNEAMTLLPEDAQLEVWDQLKLVPPFDEDDEAGPASIVLSMREAIAAADAVLIVTPEYNDSLPGQLKNAIVGCSPGPAPESSTLSCRFPEPLPSSTVAVS